MTYPQLALFSKCCSFLGDSTKAGPHTCLNVQQVFVSIEKKKLVHKRSLPLLLRLFKDIKQEEDKKEEVRC
jgi:hypothetical protein